MKNKPSMKNKKVVSIVLFIFISGTNLFAQMDNLSNMSAEWMRSAARNAATDAADVVVYNPAGITKMSDGFHLNFSNQSLFRNPSHSYDLGLGEGVKTWSQGSADLFLPNIYFAYKKNNWALYSGIFNAGGGATMDYRNGSITTDLISLGALTTAQGAYSTTTNQMLKASSMYLTTTLGGTYSIKKGWSVSMAVRNISAKNTALASMTLTSSPIDYPDQPLNLDAEYNANGWGGVISMNMSPVEHLDVSVRYETQVNLDFKTKTNKDDFGLSIDGSMNRRDLPAVFAFGAAYEWCPNFKMYADMNYYFQENADWGKSTVLTNEVPLSKLAGNAAIYALGFQYQASPKWMMSWGGGYTKMNFNDKEGYYTNIGTYEVVQSDNYNLNMGCAYKASGKVTVNAGYMHTFYPNNQTVKALLAQPLDVDVTINNSINAFAIGVDLAF